MAQLRSKQIKLVAQGDLIIGDSNANGSVLSVGSGGNFLRVSGSTLAWQTVNGTDIIFTPTAGLSSTNVSAAIAELAGTVSSADTSYSSSLSNLQSQITAVETGAGLNSSGAYVVPTGTTYLGSTTSLASATTALDSAINSVNTTLSSSISSLSSTVSDDAFTKTTSRSLSSTTKNGAINEVATDAAFAFSGTTAPTVTMDSAHGYSVGDVYVKTDTNWVYTLVDATAGGAVWQRVDNGAGLNLFTYKGTLDASTGTLPTSPSAGDMYKITVAGNFSGATGTANANDFVVYDGASWDVIAHSDSNVVGTTGRIAVSGSVDLGFTVNIDTGYVGQSSITTLGTVTTGTWNGSLVGRAFGGTGTDTSGYVSTDVVLGDFSKISKGSNNSYLGVDGSGNLVYGYVSALRATDGTAIVSVNSTSGKLEATNATTGSDSSSTLTTLGYVTSAISTATSAITRTEVEDQVTVVTPSANYVMTLTHTPVGAVGVFFNGLKLKAADFGVSGTTLTLSDSNIGYTVEAGDVLIAAYEYNG